MHPCSAAAAHTQTASNKREHQAPDVADATDKVSLLESTGRQSLRPHESQSIFSSIHCPSPSPQIPGEATVIKLTTQSFIFKARMLTV